MSVASLTITLHWQTPTGPRQANVVCEDRSPSELLPLLREGCQLPTHDEQGQTIVYALRTALPGRPMLHPARPLSAQHICDGTHIWLVPTTRGQALPTTVPPNRWVLILPNGWGELIVPTCGLTLERDWLLRALQLCDPAAYQREVLQLVQRASPLIYVSNQPHCRLEPTTATGWTISTARHDVLTLVNECPLQPVHRHPLTDGDRLRLGEGGPILTIAACRIG